MELFYQIKSNKVTMLMELCDDGMLCVKIRVNEIMVAAWDVSVVWDFMKKELSALKDSERDSGLNRRIYEAKNVHKLTDRWLEAQKKDQDFIEDFLGGKYEGESDS